MRQTSLRPGPAFASRAQSTSLWVLSARNQTSMFARSRKHGKGEHLGKRLLLVAHGHLKQMDRDAAWNIFLNIAHQFDKPSAPVRALLVP